MPGCFTNCDHPTRNLNGRPVSCDSETQLDFHDVQEYYTSREANPTPASSFSTCCRKTNHHSFCTKRCSLAVDWRSKLLAGCTSNARPQVTFARASLGSAGFRILRPSSILSQLLCGRQLRGVPTSSQS